MAQPDQCPRCHADRLSVVYYDSKGMLLGGHSQCTECGPRSAETVLPPSADVRKKLLERKAS